MLQEALPDVVLSFIATQGCCSIRETSLLKKAPWWTLSLGSYSSHLRLQLIWSVVYQLGKLKAKTYLLGKSRLRFSFWVIIVISKASLVLIAMCFWTTCLCTLNYIVSYDNWTLQKVRKILWLPPAVMCRIWLHFCVWKLHFDLNLYYIDK